MAAPRPNLTLVLGPAGSGKTRYCLDQLLARDGAGVLVVPGRQLAAVTARYGSTGCTMLASMDLLRKVALRPPSRYEMASPVLQRLMLERACREVLGPGDLLHPLLEVPGFLDSLQRFLREFRLCAGTPEDLEVEDHHEEPNAAAHGGYHARCREVARVLRAYHSLMVEASLLDEESLLIAATNRVLDGDDSWLPGHRLLLVDGFYRVLPLWSDLLAAVAAMGREVVVTLPFEEERPLLFATTHATVKRLEERFEVQRVTLQPSVLRRGALRHIERQLFNAVPAERPAASEEELLILDAPEPYAEAEMVARELLRARSEGTAWRKCAVLVRSVAEYGCLLRGVLTERYGIPMRSIERSPLSNEPLPRAALNMLEALATDWPRDRIVSYLKSSCVDPGGIGAEVLNRAARRGGVRAGRARWRALCDSLPEDSRPAPDALLRLFKVASLLGEEPQPHAAWCGLVREALQEAGLLSPRQPADRQAAERLVEVLGLLATVEDGGSTEAVPLADFVTKFRAACDAAPAPDPAREEDAVCLLELGDASGRGFEVVVIAGLLERSIPRRVAESPFLRDDEREALARAGQVRLPLSSEVPDEERLLFYLAVSAPSERLVLAFPRSGETSDSLPSFFLDEVKGLFEHVPAKVRTLADVAPSMQEAVNERERVLAACAEYARQGGWEEGRAELPFETDRPPYPRIAPMEVEAWPGLSPRVAVRDLEVYARCPFVWFAERVLQLRPSDSTVGDALRGSLYHQVLARRYRRHAGGPGDYDAARLKQELSEELDTLLGCVYMDAPDYEIALLRQWLHDAIARFAEREAHLARVFGWRPKHFELAFGEPAGPIDEDGSESPAEERDPASIARPLRLDGEPAVDVCGVIDRVDLSAEGYAMVLDYKTGRTPDARQLRAGASLQLPLYLLAAERLFGWVPAVGAMDSPREPGRRRFYRAPMVGNHTFAPVHGVEPPDFAQSLAGSQYEEMVDLAQRLARDAALGMRQAVIAPRPGEHCQTCAYGDLCRTSRDGEHDGEPSPGTQPAGVPS